jgi:FkbM family methyltransferase
MTLIIRILLHLIPGKVIERLYDSKFRYVLLPLYDYLSRNESLKIHKIFGDILIEIDLSKRGERAIPFNAFEPEITQNFLDITKEGGIIFDVGAWIGYYTLLAARNAEKVIAIEADETNCQRIKRNITLNRLSNITVLNVAIGDKSSQGILVKGLDSSMYKVASGFGRTIKIKSLDDIINEMNIHEINLLIMDIEGYEYFGLKGLQNSLSSKIIKNIICEIHPRMLKENGVPENDILEILSKYGYKVIQLQETTTSRLEPTYHIHAKCEWSFSD